MDRLASFGYTKMMVFRSSSIELLPTRLRHGFCLLKEREREREEQEDDWPRKFASETGEGEHREPASWPLSVLPSIPSSFTEPPSDNQRR
ncbi:hypothetical protein M0804_004300 [Polistes exclamans]|nr:hypothetical protein M0804_004300 [Polistes exclamans]